MSLETGVKRFIKARAMIEVAFPVDWNERKYVCCVQCPYLSSNKRMCQLNKQPVQFPQRYVGYNFPLAIIEEG